MHWQLQAQLCGEQTVQAIRWTAAQDIAVADVTVWETEDTNPLQIQVVNLAPHTIIFHT